MSDTTLSRVLDDIGALNFEELQLVDRAIGARTSLAFNSNGSATKDQIDVANALLRDTIVALPAASGEKNEGIDADLARVYCAMSATRTGNYFPPATSQPSNG